MARQNYEMIKQHSEFYRNCFHTAMRWLFAEIFVMFFLIGIVMYLIFSQHTPPYYATLLNGRIMQLS